MKKGPPTKGPNAKWPCVKRPNVIRPLIKRPHPLKALDKFQAFNNNFLQLKIEKAMIKEF